MATVMPHNKEMSGDLVDRPHGPVPTHGPAGRRLRDRHRPQRYRRAPGGVGVLLLLVARAEISGLFHALTQHELSEDPGDLIAYRLLHTANSLTRPGQLFGAGYLLVHGIVKVVLVLALLRNKLWAYPWLIGVLLIFIGYQAYRIVLSPTLGLIALTGFDVVIVALT